MTKNQKQTYESTYNIKLRTFWTQCISLFFLIFIISFAFNIFNFDLNRLVLEVILIIITAIVLSMSYIKKKLEPYHYIMLLISNAFIVTLLLVLDGLTKVTIFPYFSIIVLFTVVLFKKTERIIFVILEFLLYNIIAIYFVSTEETSIFVYNMLIQTFVSTFTIVICFLNVLKMYENKTKNLKQINNDLKENAQKDVLTKLWNREYMNQVLDDFISKNNDFSIVLFDIDYFKKINDTYGHLVGDKVLKKFAQILVKNIPKGSSAIRYGGEEFLVILPNKNLKQAFEIADKVRSRVQLDLKVKEIKRAITISGGVKQYNKGLDKTMLIEEADKNLYTAKENGRNKIII